MNFTHLIKKYLGTILLPAMCWLFINSAINWHYHQLTYGNIISHAHPYQKQNNETSPFQSHHHSDIEYIILELICHLLFFITSLFAALSLFRPFFNRIKSIYNLSPPVKEFYFIRNYHAPPVSSLNY